MKRKIACAVACAGIGLAVFAGALAINCPGGVRAASASCMQPMSIEVSHTRMPFKFFDAPAISDTEKEIAGQIRTKYENEQKALYEAFKADVAETQKSVLGERYEEIKNEMKTLKEQYKEKGIEFYNSPDYTTLIELKKEQRDILAQNKDDLGEEISEIEKKFWEDTLVIQENMRLEIDLLSHSFRLTE